MSKIGNLILGILLCFSICCAENKKPNATADIHLITVSGIGPIKLGMTIGEAKKAFSKAIFTRASDGDRAALVGIKYGKEDLMTLYADEDDPEAPIDWSKQIRAIETFNSACHTMEGIHPELLVTKVEKIYGKTIKIIKSEIESREFITFEKQPKGFGFRLDYTGIFPPDSNKTTKYNTNGKILSISISSYLGDE